MRKLFRIISTLLISLLIISCSKNNTEIYIAEVRSEIEKINAEFEAAYQSGNVEAIITLMTVEAIVSPIGLPDLKGREAIKSLLSNFLKDNTVTSYTLIVEEMEVYNDTVYDRGTYIWISQQEGKPEVKARGRYSAVRKKGADNKWRFHRIIENALP